QKTAYEIFHVTGVQTCALPISLLAWLSARVAERQIHVGYPWRIVWIIAGVVTLLWGVGLLTIELPTAARLAIRAALIALYVPIIYLTGVYTRADLEKGRELLRQRLI